MDFCYTFEKTVKNYIETHRLAEPGEHILVGVSGGADSLCLLELLWRLSGEKNWKLTAVHVHHGIRGEAADEDERFVQAYCRERGISCISRRCNVPLEAERSGEGEEEAARRLRYQMFDEIGHELLADKVALAHHRDDQAETMLFHLIRGSSLKGLCGMLPVNGNRIRPLLFVGKEEICRYLKEAGISWRTDESNFSEAYARNYLRQRVMPLLLSVNAGAISNISRAAGQLSETEAYLEEQTKEAEERMGLYPENGMGASMREAVYIKKQVYDREAGLIRRRVVYDMLCRLSGSRKDLQERHIQEIDRLFMKQSGRRLKLPYGIQARRDISGVWLEKKQQTREETEEIPLFSEQEREAFDNMSFSEPLSGSKKLPEWGRILKWKLFFMEKNAIIPKNNYTKWFDYDKISSAALFRTRRAGDWFVLDSSGGHKKLKQYFIDEKIPKEQRERLLLLADGSHIIWIDGGRISEEYKVRESTRAVLELQLISEEKRQEAD